MNTGACSATSAPDRTCLRHIRKACPRALGFGHNPQLVLNPPLPSALHPADDLHPSCLPCP
jgi:hypothetical protein